MEGSHCEQAVTFFFFLLCLTKPDSLNMPLATMSCSLCLTKLLSILPFINNVNSYMTHADLQNGIKFHACNMLAVCLLDASCNVVLRSSAIKTLQPMKSSRSRI